MISGRIIDQEGDPVISAIIIAKRTDRGVSPDDQGRFRIVINLPDTIVVSAMGYLMKKVPVSLSDSTHRLMNIMLVARPYELNSVVIQAPRNYDEVKEEIKGLKPFEYQVNGIGAISSPITYLYERFSKRVQSEKKVAELENEDLKREALKGLLSQYVSRDIIKMDEAEFDDFLNYCRLTDEFIINASQYDLVMELKRSYEMFRKMKGR